MTSERIKKIMITGGAGFIGSRLVRGILRDEYDELVGAHVVVVDLLTYAGNVENVPNPMSEPRLTFAHEDICDVSRVEPLMRDCDVVVHLAAESHVDRSIDGGAREFVTTNVLGTQALLDAALRCGVRRFVYVSTDEVYGSIPLGSFSEIDPVNPTSPYAASKTAGEHLVRAYARTYDMNVVITRGANTYGPYQHPEKLIPRFITRLLTGRTVPLYGDGHHVRSWLHVRDHCDGIYRALVTGKSGATYNVRGHDELSNRQLTEMLIQLCGADWSYVTRAPDRLAHDERYAIDGALALRDLGYEPLTPLECGLRDTVSWYRENRDWWLSATEADRWEASR